MSFEPVRIYGLLMYMSIILKYHVLRCQPEEVKSPIVPDSPLYASGATSKPAWPKFLFSIFYWRFHYGASVLISIAEGARKDCNRGIVNDMNLDGLTLNIQWSPKRSHIASYAICYTRESELRHHMEESVLHSSEENINHEYHQMRGIDMKCMKFYM